MPDLHAVAAELDIPDAQNLSSEFWPSSMSTFPRHSLEFLSEDFIADACAYSQLPPPIQSELTAAARRINSRPAARALFWHTYCLLAQEQGNIHEWPDPIPALASDTGPFFLLALLSLIPQTKQIHARHCIPAKIIRDSMTDIVFHIERHKSRHGVYGSSARQSSEWLPHHFHGRLYRLGRLNFKLLAWKWPPRAFRWQGEGSPRHIHNRPIPNVLIFAGQGQTFRPDGQLNGAGGITETQNLWTSELSIDATQITGQLIDPAPGAALPEKISLSTGQWKQILTTGDQLIDIHIPELGPLDFEQCRAALVHSREFFAKHFPAISPVAYYCASWLLDPQLEIYLPPTANIIRFSREFYRLPIKSGPDTIQRLASNPLPRDPKAPPRETTLQRGMAAHVRAGNHWRGAGALFFLEDFNWGAQVYLTER